MNNINDINEFTKNLKEYDESHQMDSVIGIDINEIEDTNLIEDYNSFTATEKKVITIFLKYPFITGIEATKIMGSSPVWISEVKNRIKVSNFISKLQIYNTIDVIRLNFVLAQEAIGRNLKDSDSKIREKAIDNAIKVFEKFQNNKTFSSSGGNETTNPELLPTGI